MLTPGAIRPGMTPTVERLRGGLVVSCQAPVDSPLREPSTIAAMAQAAVMRGAVGIRLDTPEHVRAARSRLGANVPIIGLWKQTLPGSSVYITPRFADAQAIAAAGADIIAIDATWRSRPEGDTAAHLIERIHRDLGKLVMADIDTLEAAEAAAAAGADLLGTTLYGYTEETQGQTPPGWELLAQMVDRLDVPCVCEGGIASPEMARRAIDAGAFAVVVGTAITGIDLQVMAYQRALTAS